MPSAKLAEEEEVPRIFIPMNELPPGIKLGAGVKVLLKGKVVGYEATDYRQGIDIEKTGLMVDLNPPEEAQQGLFPPPSPTGAGPVLPST